MIRRISPFRWLPAMALISATANALPPMPAESGWSGYVNLGASAMSVENNMVNGIASFDLGKARVSSLDQSADNEDVVIPAVYFELAYTLAMRLDAIWVLGVGLTYQLAEGRTVDVNANYLNLGKAPVDTGEGLLGRGRVVGESSDPYAITPELAYHF